MTLLEEQALEQARQADEQRARGRAQGVLHGLPVLVKDSFETAGVRTTSGSKTLAAHVPKQDAAAVACLKEAGAIVIVIGKTNLPEFASDWQSYNDVAGTTNNPWDVTRTPGGSIGGGAAALAAGLGYLEIGSDIAGSIRVPSHFCGVYGHMPTFGIVPLQGHVPAPPGTAPGPLTLPVAGPLARSAADLLLDLNVLAGRRLMTPWRTGGPYPSLAEADCASTASASCSTIQSVPWILRSQAYWRRRSPHCERPVFRSERAGRKDFSRGDHWQIICFCSAPRRRAVHRRRGLMSCAGYR